MAHDDRDAGLATLLSSLLLDPYAIDTSTDLFFGDGTLHSGDVVHVLGIAHGTTIGVEQALQLSAYVLSVAEQDDATPLLCLIDSSSQRMSRRDELLGLYECLAHLAKSIMLAEKTGHPTIAVMYGGSAAGAFIATALACSRLFAVAGAHPEVMDLPSISRVTKLPLEMLARQAEVTPVFAPGVDNFFKTGGISQMWKTAYSLTDSFLDAVTSVSISDVDLRAALGLERGGRPRAAEVAARVSEEAQRHG